MSELDEHITLEDFERLYSEYKPRFIIIARSYIRNNMAAEDIVTDSFLYFWENKDKLNFRIRETWLSWMAAQPEKQTQNPATNTYDGLPQHQS